MPDHVREYTELVGGSGQVIPFLATCAGLKPAMDDWVPVERWPEFRDLAQRIGLRVSTDAAFEFMRGRDVPADVVGGERLNTTRAFGHPPRRARPGQRMHVFLARREEDLRRIIAEGWYPLVIGDRVVEKPWSDHFRFGAALGYPHCCRAFFAKHNDWWADNHLYQAFGNTGTPRAVANPLLKYTGMSYAAYLPCAFDCEPTVRYAARVRDEVRRTCPELAEYADSMLRRTFLVLSEWEIVGFAGARRSGGSPGHGLEYDLEYDDVVYVPTDRPDAELFQTLAKGNRLAVSDGLIVVFRDGRHVDTVRTSSERFGPQAPFLVDFAA